AHHGARPRDDDAGAREARPGDRHGRRSARHDEVGRDVGDRRHLPRVVHAEGGGRGGVGAGAGRHLHVPAADVGRGIDGDRRAHGPVVDGGRVRLVDLVGESRTSTPVPATTWLRLTPIASMVNVLPRLPKGGRTSPRNGAPARMTRKVALAGVPTPVVTVSVWFVFTVAPESIDTCVVIVSSSTTVWVPMV